MAILHRTWTFDPRTAHGEISARVLDGNSNNSRALLELTRETVDHADAATAHYLEMVRYDPEWLDEDDLDEAHLYVACLGPYLTPAPNADHPLCWSCSSVTG
jgi:hypothetical protein